MDFTQYLFLRQWKKLKDYANAKEIKIIGDLPIYVAEDSSDVWSNPRIFNLDENLYPITVAGCPPDGFTDTGQLWEILFIIGRLWKMKNMIGG